MHFSKHFSNWFRPSVMLAVVLVAQPVFAFQSPLSDESVREAYFLGQRHDGTFERLLEKSTQRLPPPKSGPYISSVTVLTPFLQVAQLSSDQNGNYSAQQAALDHRGEGEETLRIVVEIMLFDSDSQLVAPGVNSSRPGSLSAVSPWAFDFFTNVQVQIYNGEQQLKPSSHSGHPNYSCGDHGPCLLTGATLEYDFPASAFSADSATVQVDPPKGDAVGAEFDLSRLR